MSNSKFKNFCLWLISRFQFNEEKRFYSLLKRGYYDDMSDEECIKRQFYYAFGYPLDLKNPKTFNEKLQWLKLYNRKPEYTMMADKIAVKDYVAKIIGKEHIIPTLGVWEHFDDIDFEKLPNQFVLKCNHDCGSVVIVKDKNNFDKVAAKKKLEKALSKNFYLKHREWVYKDIKPRIFAEEFVEDSNQKLVDYKVHCFNGEPKFLIVFGDRFGKNGMTDDFFDVNWQHLSVARPGHLFAKEDISKPANLDLMLVLARKLSAGIKFLRVDFYSVDGRVLFGEMTFYPAAGFEKFVPEEWDEIFGNWIKLPSKKFVGGENAYTEKF